MCTDVARVKKYSYLSILVINKVLDLKKRNIYAKKKAKKHE